MKYEIAGFNQFGQYHRANKIISSFETILPSREFGSDDHRILLQRWCYNILANKKCLEVTGIGLGCINATNEIVCPFDVSELNDNLITSGDDERLLVYDKISRQVWLCNFMEEPEPIWKTITPFLNVETSGNAGDIVKVVAKGLYKLCLTSSGFVYQLPQRVLTDDCDGKVIDIDCGNNHGILLTEKGSVYTWGHGRRCQLGHGDLENVEQPQLVEALAGLPIKKICAGGWHNCALSHSGDIYTWGWNEKGQLGLKLSDESVASQAEPQLVDLYDDKVLDVNIIDVSCGSKHTVLQLEDNSLWVSGCNSFGQCGLDPEEHPVINIFTKIYHPPETYTIKCGHWSTLLVYDQS